jgi:transcriptional regulator with XRE-family HTH domain
MIKRRNLLQPRKKQRRTPARIWRSRLFIRELREAREVSLTELARGIGKTKGMISQIENGHSAASAETLEDIAEFFGLAHVGLLFEAPARKGFRRLVRFIPVDNNSTT